MFGLLNRFRGIALAGVIAVPLDSAGPWQVLKYSDIPANKVEFSKAGMKISVDRSASPIIYPLTKRTKVHRIHVSGKVTGALNFAKGEIQGEKGVDDYLFRLGLVVAGQKTLSGPKSWFAPGWIKRLFALAPKGEGVDHIHFLVLGSRAEHLGRVRQHPLSELLKEEVVLIRAKTGEFELDHKLKKALDVVAVWLSLDGDDTGSKFFVNLNKITMSSAEEK